MDSGRPESRAEPLELLAGAALGELVEVVGEGLVALGAAVAHVDRVEDVEPCLEPGRDRDRVLEREARGRGEVRREDDPLEVHQAASCVACGRASAARAAARSSSASKGFLKKPAAPSDLAWSRGRSLGFAVMKIAGSSRSFETAR